MKLNKALFIDIEGCLTSTVSGRKIPLRIDDWKFNDLVIQHIRDNEYNTIVLIPNRPSSEIINKYLYDIFINTVKSNLYKLVKVSIQSLNYNYRDTYYNFPYPASIYNIAITNNIILKHSTYISDSEKALEYSSIGNIYTYSKFILNG